MPHIHKNIDFTAEVFVVYDNKVLLRKHDKYRFWLSVGGHIELDENPNQAAIREVREEVGLNVSLVGKRLSVNEEGKDYQELIPPRFLNIHKISDTHNHVSLVYFAVANTNRLVNSQIEYSDEIKWFSSGDLRDSRYQLRDSIKQYASTALNEVTNT